MKVQVADIKVTYREVEYPDTCPHCHIPASPNADGEGFDPFVSVLTGEEYQGHLQPMELAPHLFRVETQGRATDEWDLGYFGKHIPVIYSCGGCNLPLIEGKVAS